jgi:pimeloyl-ACP methyl ester carboxylesterase
LNCREYGESPYKAIVVHGGPGAPGCCAGICRGLADTIGVLEHLQEKNTTQELVDEMQGIILRYSLDKVILVGHSWGAWLSFIFAAKYPQYVSKLILVGCGPFELKYYPLLVEARSKKGLTSERKADIQAANLYSPETEYEPDHYCLLPDIREDMIAFNETQFKSLMDEAMRMRASGELLNYSNDIRCPVVAIQGKNDPHPWEGVKIPLENRLHDFKMFVLDKCGHDPWNEYYAKDEFFAILKNEITCES